jgi:predicted Zn-dependent protease
MPTPKLPKPIVDIFADIFSLGHTYGKVGEIHTLLNFMSSMYPDIAQIVAAKADILLRIGDYREARAMLETADIRTPNTPILKAMLAFCLLAQNDNMWESYANETMALPVDEAARTIVQALATARGVTLDGGSTATSASEPQSHLPPMGIAC